MISIKNIEVVFGAGGPNENRALQSVSLDVPTSQFLTVIGSNGAGKSTLLNAVAGTVAATSGDVVIDGKSVVRLREHQRATDIARVFQDPLAGTCGALTIEENLALADRRGQARGFRLALTGNQKDRYRDRLSVLGLGLENRLSDRMDLLSGGQRQAVCLIMATLAPSKVILLDEHTAALDPVMAELIADLTEKVVEDYNLTALMITHSMAQALRYGDRTIMMHRGQIALDLDHNARANMDVPDLVAAFSTKIGETLDQDDLVL
ncbi:ABC transporter ATP-binding protein [Epibacterium sp. Ofav1-8]|uniref:ABC transporter ATP-binding protein n=1 Tax=Epibacterium sp. Ofav1-8 TaxID=2917735 RepID=UPI001EF71EAC|nr:ABC transporter ATP-binding protein [Epibacterium sp. Ofav1-8]MCG7626080.1 ABC transporter ATP-binding protein [Epibacterium sp. Ofav1-8]